MYWIFLLLILFNVTTQLTFTKDSIIRSFIDSKNEAYSLFLRVKTSVYTISEAALYEVIKENYGGVLVDFVFSGVFINAECWMVC